MEKERRIYCWCTYRDWSFRILEGIQEIEGWRAGLILTTPDCLYDFSRLEKRGIPVLRDDPRETLKKGGRAHEMIMELQPETMFFSGWSWIVPGEILELCPCITQHPGKLPRDRGGSPLQNQVRNGESWTYANMLKMGEGLDTGPVYMKARISLDGDAEDIFARMTATGTRLTRDYLSRLARGGFSPTPQGDGEATFYPRVKRRQSRLRLDRHSARQMYDIIRVQNETDPNSYVRPAYLVMGAQTLVIDRATLDGGAVKGEGLNLRLTSPEMPGGLNLYELCEKVNNNEATLALEDREGAAVYLTRFHVRDR